MSKQNTWALLTGEYVMVSPKLVAEIGYPAAAAAYVLHYRSQPEDDWWLRHSFRIWGDMLGVGRTAAYEGLKRLAKEGLAEEDSSREPFAYRLSYEGMARFAGEQLGLSLTARAEVRLRERSLIRNPDTDLSEIRTADGSASEVAANVGPALSSEDVDVDRDRDVDGEEDQDQDKKETPPPPSAVAREANGGGGGDDQVGRARSPGLPPTRSAPRSGAAASSRPSTRASARTAAAGSNPTSTTSAVTGRRRRLA